MSREKVWAALKGVMDPELGVNVVDLGLIYRAEWDDGDVVVDMGVTSPACPLGDQMVSDAETLIRAEVTGVRSLVVRLVMEPPWTPERMSAEAKAQLGW